MPGILGRKIGMTRIIQDDGRVIPLTIVECEPNEVVQVKTTEKDGYPAVVLGFSKLSRPTKNRKFYHLKEFRVAEENAPKQGDVLNISMFEENEGVKVTSTSKGKGTQGTIKRHNFSRGPMSHGSHHKREPGSVGTCAKPGRIHKGKKMAGRMGNEQVTVKNTQVVYINADKNIIGIKGPIPGAKNNLVIIRKLS
ncbi:50S ribosomal protein L3 [Candidatus Peregrinibacteria bacterium CG22_combo_CG10-13_8_21_14_all_44_10]|nr:MAG: 50S ribosomal protein L3 [Candidatus Peregrinibacteria bacterium CG2_30_44_17]PIP66050.1 MAG: 50S ribosomal protein L3 [Candidatus Peregrinibacteria bacterium CG22_combo_CG10-13_8_21_14_all_44_10]PIS03633.1 MAG: 50S ribosomal protein L3 [Candidatus Peregrinibacteria bacterium CG10_big_fil_rev_8_21_14_0_10_44_7]PIX78896.1 MAG: 50S ribosomal protein L3 [Candidatus Peregrinibacteria bacterium CG_4_10_14_3_um_filter_44_21]PJB88853.1 MAG: 50S ribosomal protein L3 [Candidatus Peregrinibacteri